MRRERRRRSPTRASTSSGTCSSVTSRTARSRARARAEKHRLRGGWIESLGRLEDHAEMLAHHYLSCARVLASRARPRQRHCEERTSRAPGGGSRAFALSAYPAAAKFYEAAVELWPADDRVPTGFSSKRAQPQPLEPDRATERAHGGSRRAARGRGFGKGGGGRSSTSARTTGYGASGTRPSSILENAAAMVADQPNSHSKAMIMSLHSRFRMLAGDTTRPSDSGTRCSR